MAQVKIYGRREHLSQLRPALSEAIHQCLIDVLQLPDEKRFQRFLPMDADDFLHPRGPGYGAHPAGASSYGGTSG